MSFGKKDGFKSKGGNAKPFKNNKNKAKQGKMIMFDREKRIEFVTGFKKRKDERRFKAKIEAKQEIKDERKEL